MLCIKNGKLVTPRGVREQNLYIRGDRIFSVGGYWAGADEYDAEGCYVFPGFVDAHVHFATECARIPTADSCETGSEAAITGGITTVIDFAAQQKGDSLLEAIDTWGSRAAGSFHCDYAFHMAVTDWQAETEREIQRLADMGVASYKAFMAYDKLRLDDDAILALFRAAADIGFVGVHCELGDMITANVTARLAAGETEPVCHALCHTEEAEALAVRRCLELAREAGVPVWVVHLSTAAGLEEIRRARERGQFVLAETCPHYLTLTDELYLQPEEESVKYVCSPPLRTRADAEALWQAVASGEIQLISSDHCSYTAADKLAGGRIDFTHICNGLPSVEYGPALLWSEGVARGRITPVDMARIMAEFPAKAFGIYPRKGMLRAGADADVVIWDGEAVKTISPENTHMNVDYTPWDGWTVTGQPKAVFLRGALTVSGGMLLRERQGEYIESRRVF